MGASASEGRMVPVGEPRSAREANGCPSLRISLAEGDLVTARVVQWILVAVTVLAIGVTGLLVWETHEQEGEAGRYEQAVLRLQDANRRFIAQATDAGIDLSESRAIALVREVTFSNQLVDRRAFSWTRLLTDLEEAVPPRVSISSVTLNFKEGRITLNGQARTLKDLTELVTALENHRAFENVALAQHRSEGRADQRSPGGGAGSSTQAIAFTLSVGYRASSS